MSKEIDDITCGECESDFRLIYQPNDVSGLPKFCPFCGADIYNEDEKDDEVLEED